MRECRECQRYILNGKGEVETFGDPPQPIPRDGPPPCWQCPKWPDAVPAGDRHPFEPGDDFGPWFDDLYQWYREGRAVGFPPDTPPLLRQVAAEFDAADRAQAARQTAELITLALRQRR